jgi:hypothetical protein
MTPIVDTRAVVAVEHETDQRAARQDVDALRQELWTPSKSRRWRCEIEAEATGRLSRRFHVVFQ